MFQKQTTGIKIFKMITLLFKWSQSAYTKYKREYIKHIVLTCIKKKNKSKLH